MPRKNAGSAIAVSGLSGLNRALKKAEGDIDKDLRNELREIANVVRDDARSRAPEGDGRSGKPGRLRSSIRSSVVVRGASLYSNSPYALVQDQGGTVGYGAVITRARASGYMSKAVQFAQPMVSRRLEGVLDHLGREFDATT